MTRKPPIDVHQQVTDAIIAAIESNPGEYRMPWQRSGLAAGLPTNALTKASYSGINICILLCAAVQRGYAGSNRWATFKQFLDLKTPVRAGEKGTLICFYKQYEVEAEGPDDDGKRLAVRHSYVFHEIQTEGYVAPDVAEMPPLARHAQMERLLTSTKADVLVGGDRAFYSVAGDFIQLPDPRYFTQNDTGERQFQFESTCAHEAVHWSGAPSRLARDLTGRFGSDSYAMEELIALSGQSG